MRFLGLDLGKHPLYILKAVGLIFKVLETRQYYLRTLLNIYSNDFANLKRDKIEPQKPKSVVGFFNPPNMI